MKYLRLNLQYLFAFGRGKRFLLLFLIVLPAAVAGAFSCPLSKFLGWFVAYPGGYRNYLQLTAQMFGNFQWGICIIFLFIAVATVSMVMSVNNHCLRTGKLTVMRPLRFLNENLMPSFFMVVASLILFVVWLAFTVLFIFLFHYIRNAVIGQVLSILFFLLALVGLAMFLATCMLWLPIMSHNGIRAMKAFPYAIEKSGMVWFRVTMAILPIMALLVVGGFLTSLTKSSVAMVIADIVLYACMFVYMLTLCDIVFFDTEGLPREDMPRGYSARRFR